MTTQQDAPGGLAGLAALAGGSTVARYYQMPDGSLSKMTASHVEVLPPPPANGQEITAEEYAAAQAEIDRVEAERDTAAAEADAERQRAEYRELRGTGVGHALAARLTGYTGPDEKA